VYSVEKPTLQQAHHHKTRWLVAQEPYLQLTEEQTMIPSVLVW